MLFNFINLDLYFKSHMWLVTTVSQCRSSQPLVDSEYTSVGFFFIFIFGCDGCSLLCTGFL